MSRPPLTVFISAGEASGDAHAAELIDSIRRRLGDVRFVGAGGPKMAQAGCEMLVETTARASMLAGPLLQLGYYWRMIRRLRRQIAQIGPDLHVPVDSPALNWHLAAAAKRAGAKVVYYISPQVWAWAPWRVKKLARLTDHVACILPFEQAWLRNRGVEATYVGHPMFDYLPPRADPMPDILDAWTTGRWRIALLPGSRPAEIANHAAVLAETARAIRARWDQAVCTFAAADERAADAIRARLGGCGGGDDRCVKVTTGQTHELIAGSHLAIAASGTVTLEVAHYGVPMVVFYRVSRLAYNLLGRWLLRTPHLSLVNILAGRQLVPELMPWYGREGQLIDAVMEVMDDPGWLVGMRGKLLSLAETLTPHAGDDTADGRASAADNTAELIERVLRQ